MLLDAIQTLTSISLTANGSIDEDIAFACMNVVQNVTGMGDDQAGARSVPLQVLL